jgi:transposase
MLLKSTQTCSHCLALTGPRGLRGLSVSDWTCKACGRHHKRNENSANNHRLAYKNWKEKQNASTNSNSQSLLENKDKTLISNSAKQNNYPFGHERLERGISVL